MQTIGERLREVRESAKLDQAKFAAELGVSRNTISAWERGLNYPPADSLAIIYEKFGVSIEWLVTGKGGMKGWPHGIKLIPTEKTIHIVEDSSADWKSKAYDAAQFALLEAPAIIALAETPIDYERQSLIYRYLIDLIAELRREELVVIFGVLERWLASSLSHHVPKE